MIDRIQYIVSGLFVMCVFVLLFAGSKPKNKTIIYNTSGEAVDVRQINFSFEKKYSEDSLKQSSLDGDQNIPIPPVSTKPFDPGSPFTKLTFRMLRTYIPGKPVPEEIKNLNDNNVEILGFMVPLNALQNMDEFLLCSAPPLSCYCAPPIFINEIIYVKLLDQKTDFLTGAIRIKGQFHVNTDVKDEYSDIIYTINNAVIE